MALKKENNYFKMIEGLVELSYQAATELNKILSNFDATTIKESKEHLHTIEHNADIKKHEMMKKLSKEFITPIERSDIMSLAQEIDEVTDSIEEVLVKVYMYNISVIRPEAIQLSEVIVKCCESLIKVMAEFHNFRKSQTIHQYIVEINGFEEDGDKIYIDSMCGLFRDGSSDLEKLVWKDMFESLERCCDACEHVSDVVESVIMKNS